MDTNIKIEIDETLEEGVYSNMALISHSPTEFVLDFVSIMPAVEKAKVKSRIILHPEHAKSLLMMLDENIARYEETFGEIIPKTITPDGELNIPFTPKAES